MCKAVCDAEPDCQAYDFSVIFSQCEIISTYAGNLSETSKLLEISLVLFLFTNMLGDVQENQRWNNFSHKSDCF